MTWPLVPLGEVLTQNEERITLTPDQTYREVTVRLWGKGVMLRRLATGAEIAGEGRFVVRTNQFIASRIDARNGAFGLIPPELDGAIVTNDFPTFNVDSSRLIPEFLGWQCRTSGFVDLARAASEGTTNRVRLKGASFLATTIPLPGVEEQRRIMARVDAIASRVAEARRLRDATTHGIGVVIQSARRVQFRSLTPETPRRPIGEATETRLGKMLSAAGNLGIAPAPYLRNANIHDDRIDLRSVYDMDFGDNEKEEFRLRAGDIMINEGGYGVGRCAVWDGAIEPCYFQKSLHRVRVDPAKIVPRFLMHQLIWAREEGFFDDITKATTFQHLTGVRLKRHQIAIPPLDEQRRIVAHLDALQAKLDAVRAIQGATSAELGALLPSVLNQAFAGKL